MMKRKKNTNQRSIWKVVVILVVTLALVLPGSAVFANFERNVNNEQSNVTNNGRLDTHTVFAEYGTSTSCGYCKYAHAALKKIYASGQYPFYYVSLVGDKNTVAYDRLKNDYHLYGYPTVFFDGGYKVNLGGGSGNEAQYKSSINICGIRDVSDIDIVLDVAWLGGTEMKINVSVYNNEVSTYDGHIRVYITEIVSSMGWVDTAGYQYTFAFLDYAFNEDISISGGDTWSDSITWSGSAHGYNSITEDNIMVIATVFNDERHQGYAKPPSSNPFNAYYVDDTTAAVPGNSQPEKPDTPSGSTTGITGVKYNYTSSTVDTDEDGIYYLFDWGDGTDSGWIGPYASGDPVEANHSWDYNGSYQVRVKAKDINYMESIWSDSLTVRIGNIPVIEISHIAGGLFKVRAVIKNTGNLDAYNVNWNIILNGGLIVLGKETSGVIPSIPAGEEVIVKSDLIVGFGKPMITVIAEISESSDVKEQESFVFLFFIKTGE